MGPSPWMGPGQTGRQMNQGGTIGAEIEAGSSLRLSRLCQGPTKYYCLPFRT